MRTEALLVYETTRLLCPPHHPLDLTPVIPLLSLLLTPVLVAPMLGVGGRDSGSACGRLGACAEAAMEPAPSFALHGELRTRRT